MVPPIGINRLSLNLFTDIGGAWDTGNKPTSYYTGVGAELIGEVKLLYTLGLQLRLGVAQGLDDPKGTQAYLTLGRAF
jgi:outer membrane protein assembly factor BamA